jgi:nicotinate phosphoribosyltransferase
MAHSYVQAHASELDAFRAFTALYPDTVLLVDTYDTARGVQNVVRLAQEQGERFAVRAIRLDSGDLAVHAVEARAILDDAGLRDVRIFASGGLDEHAIAALLARGAPIDAFGVGTAMGVSADAPSLDIVYKLVEYAGEGRVKLSTGKPVLPGAKQVFRIVQADIAHRDVIALADEDVPGLPLLEPAMQAGRSLRPPDRLEEARARARGAIAGLPARLRSLEPAAPPYEVHVSQRLASLHALAAKRASGTERTS